MIENHLEIMQSIGCLFTLLVPIDCLPWVKERLKTFVEGVSNQANSNKLDILHFPNEKLITN